MSLLSEEDNDDYSSQDDTDFDDFDRTTGRRTDATPRVSGRNRKRQQINNRQTRKNINQKNIKQKVVALLRRFRIPDDDDNVSLRFYEVVKCAKVSQRLSLNRLLGKS